MLKSLIVPPSKRQCVPIVAVSGRCALWLGAIVLAWPVSHYWLGLSSDSHRMHTCVTATSSSHSSESNLPI